MARRDSRVARPRPDSPSLRGDSPLLAVIPIAAPRGLGADYRNKRAEGRRAEFAGTFAPRCGDCEKARMEKRSRWRIWGIPGFLLSVGLAVILDWRGAMEGIKDTVGVVAPFVSVIAIGFIGAGTLMLVARAVEGARGLVLTLNAKRPVNQLRGELGRIHNIRHFLQRSGADADTPEWQAVRNEKARLEAIGIACPRADNAPAWKRFICELEPLVGVGDLKEARRLHDRLEEEAPKRTRRC